MRYLIAIIAVALLITSCNKDKFTTVPQISFKSFSPNTWYSNSTVKPGPMMNINLTDAEGDFGFSDNKDTSYVYVKNLTIPPYNIDSLKFPDLGNATRKNLDVEVSFDLQGGSGILQGSGIAHHIDTLYFEVYVKDFAKNKSNVIKSDAFYLINP